MSIALFWFRQDLRIHDNPALRMACEQHQQLIPLYIKEKQSTLPMGGAQHWWLHHSLTALKQSLQNKDLDLYLIEAEPLSLLKQLIATHHIDAIYWNRCYEPAYRRRDQEIKAQLRALGIKVISCNGSLLQEPWQVLNKSGSYFKVFTPYWRQAKSQIHLETIQQIEQWPALYPLQSATLEEWNLLPQNPNWASEFSLTWQPGEQGAWEKMDDFITNQLANYAHDRNIPAIIGTSKIAPHLHFGEISPQRLWIEVQQKMHDPLCDQNSAATFLSEIGWREFSYQLLYHVPELPEQPLKKAFNAFPWAHNEELLRCWQKGLTGYPIVDAGMRELWAHGTMHNRVRMIVASFLTKHLLIDWRYGAAWFWDTLLDADLANNSASWQWVAGCGADAAPYFRIFNPTAQGEQFDPSGFYVKQWVPELAHLPVKWIHKPWEAPANLRAKSPYPAPIVDHAWARQRALDSYQQIKNES